MSGSVVERLLAAAGALACCAVLVVGCAAAPPEPEPRDADPESVEDAPRPRAVMSLNGRYAVRVERYRCRCAGRGAHVEAAVRVRHARGPRVGTTAWVAPLDDDEFEGLCSGDATAPAPFLVTVEPGGSGELVIIRANGSGKARRYRIATGEQVE